jgi:rhodanese-related sulfurtransferase
MAPLDLASMGSWAPGLTALLLGVGMGFALERGGLGRAPLLAAQFYLNDMRVLKTMFTAIITAMVLVLIATGLGWLDDTALWINPTHLWPGILGGLLLGVGFIVGGYCPGTSLVAIATGKLDGLAFALGILVGTVLFGSTVGLYWSSWHHWSDLGTLTLYDWMGIPKHWLVLGIVLMALSWFVGAHWLERWRGELPATTPRAKRWMGAGTLVLLSLTALGVVLGQPDLDDRVELHAAALDATLGAREVHLPPDELLDIMHNTQLSLVLVDVRGDADFNRFHLLGSLRLPAVPELAPWVAALDPASVVVLVGNDEDDAEGAWRRLSVLHAPNLYLLEGGVTAWLERFSGELGERALGSRHELSRPDPASIEARPYTPRLKVKVASGGGGGCG